MEDGSSSAVPVRWCEERNFIVFTEYKTEL